MNYESYKLPMNKMYLHVEPSNLRVLIFNLKKHIFIGGVGEFYNLGFESAGCNVSSMGCSVSSPDETLRRELKIRCAAEYF